MFLGEINPHIITSTSDRTVVDFRQDNPGSRKVESNHIIPGSKQIIFSGENKDASKEGKTTDKPVKTKDKRRTSNSLHEDFDDKSQKHASRPRSGEHDKVHGQHRPSDDRMRSNRNGIHLGDKSDYSSDDDTNVKPYSSQSPNDRMDSLKQSQIASGPARHQRAGSIGFMLKNGRKNSSLDAGKGQLEGSTSGTRSRSKSREEEDDTWRKTDATDRGPRKVGFAMPGSESQENLLRKQERDNSVTKDKERNPSTLVAEDPSRVRRPSIKRTIAPDMLNVTASGESRDHPSSQRRGSKLQKDRSLGDSASVSANKLKLKGEGRYFIIS